MHSFIVCMWYSWSLNGDIGDIVGYVACTTWYRWCEYVVERTVASLIACHIRNVCFSSLRKFTAFLLFVCIINRSRLFSISIWFCLRSLGKCFCFWLNCICLCARIDWKNFLIIFLFYRVFLSIIPLSCHLFHGFFFFFFLYICKYASVNTYGWMVIPQSLIVRESFLRGRVA